MFRRMHFGENGEEIAVERGGIGHARVAEQQREDGGHGDQEAHPGAEARGAGAVKALDKETGDEGSVLGFAPRDDAKQAGLHGQIKHRDAENREENSAGDIFFGIADFAAEVADVVVAPVAVNRVDHRGAEPGEPQGRKMERAGRKIKRQFGIEVADASTDKPEHGANNANPQQNRNFADGGDFPVKKNHEKNNQAA